MKHLFRKNILLCARCIRVKESKRILNSPREQNSNKNLHLNIELFLLKPTRSSWSDSSSVSGKDYGWMLSVSFKISKNIKINVNNIQKNFWKNLEGSPENTEIHPKNCKLFPKELGARIEEFTIKSNFSIFLGGSCFWTSIEKSLKGVNLTDENIAVRFHFCQFLSQAPSFAEARSGGRWEVVRCQRDGTSMSA